MRLPELDQTVRNRLFGGVLLAMLAAAPAASRAESAYVEQVPSGAITSITLRDVLPKSGPSGGMSSHRPSAAISPETAAAPANYNSAQTLEIGAQNKVYQFQSGTGNVSAAGVIGSYNNLAVLQSGNNLRSNVVLLNTVGMNVGVIQPPGSAPVNVLIARLPGGGLLIKR